eukprot:9639339-Prorocentrum_lima.AAC.1
MRPRYWLYDSDCFDNPYCQAKIVQYDDSCQFMHHCFWSNNDRIFDDVLEICGGTAKVSGNQTTTLQ